MRRDRVVMVVVAGCLLLSGGPGCASMRRLNLNRDLRPCSDGFAETADGWRLGVRHYRPIRPDPRKLPVVQKSASAAKNSSRRTIEIAAKRRPRSADQTVDCRSKDQ